jgi:hypothetical protein
MKWSLGFNNIKSVQRTAESSPARQCRVELK